MNLFGLVLLALGLWNLFIAIRDPKARGWNRNRLRFIVSTISLLLIGTGLLLLNILSI
jgi:hypothetical protein